MAAFTLSRSFMAFGAAPILILQLVGGSAAPASAMCVAQGTELVWSYPADGARDVPIDATLWAWSRELNVRLATLNGKRVDHEPVGFGGVRIEPGSLEPNTGYALTLKGSREQGKVVISFRTGVQPSPELSVSEKSFDVEGYTTSGELPSDPFCSRVVEAQDCFDTGQDTLLILYPTTIDARAWLMVPRSGSPGDTIIWPAECGAPSVYLHGARLPTLCYRIHAIGLGGKLSTMQTACGFGQETTATPCPDDAPATETFTPASILSKVEPLPTHIAWAARLGGTVLTRATIDRSGAVTEAEVVAAPERLATFEGGVRSTTLGLDRQVLDRIRTWRFAPATQDGQPVDSTVCLRTEFVEPPKDRYQRTTRSH